MNIDIYKTNIDIQNLFKVFNTENGSGNWKQVLKTANLSKCLWSLSVASDWSSTNLEHSMAN